LFSFFPKTVEVYPWASLSVPPLAKHLWSAGMTRDLVIVFFFSFLTKIRSQVVHHPCPRAGPLGKAPSSWENHIIALVFENFRRNWCPVSSPGKLESDPGTAFDFFLAFFCGTVLGPVLPPPQTKLRNSRPTLQTFVPPAPLLTPSG